MLSYYTFQYGTNHQFGLDGHNRRDVCAERVDKGAANLGIVGKGEASRDYREHFGSLKP